MGQAHVFEQLTESLRARPWQEVVLEPLPVEELPTPALVLDENVLTENLHSMVEFLSTAGKGMRPHAKTHKCPVIAHRQLEAGALGVCAAKVSEALVLVSAGVDRVLITSPVVTPAKASLLGLLASQASMSVVVDSVAGITELGKHVPAGASLEVLIDVDVDMGRTGTRSVDAVLRLAELCAEHPRLVYAGIQHYAGHVMHVSGHAERRSRSLALWEEVGRITEALNQAGLMPEVVTGAGTGTYDIDCEVAGITDLQVGSFIFMDEQYRQIGSANGDVFDDFQISLSVAATAISRPVPGKITVDAGLKAFASETVAPRAMDFPDSEYRFGGDEHGIVSLGGTNLEPQLGDVWRFATPHCDPTVNLYDGYWVHANGLVHGYWPIAARGCSW